MKAQGFSFLIRRKIYATYCKFAKIIWQQATRGDDEKRWDKKEYKEHKRHFILEAIKMDLYNAMHAGENAEKAKAIAKLMKGAKGSKHGLGDFDHGQEGEKTKKKAKKMQKSIEKVANQDVASAVEADTGVPPSVTKTVLRDTEGAASHMLSHLL